MAAMPRTLIIALAAASAGLLGGLSFSVAADQPLMQSALSHLEAAERDLERATPDKGGHRVEALRLVRAAQKEVRKGVKFDRQR